MKIDWYLTRATGAVALMLLTVALVLGVAEIGRVASRRWPRFAIDGLHRRASLLALVFLGVHILTAVLDGFAPISLIDAVVPFIGTYRPLWLGLGAIACDLLLAVIVTSLLRRWLGRRGWRLVHWLAYAVWPVAVLHGLGTGSDVRQTWMASIYIGCASVVVLAILVRGAIGWPSHPGRRTLAAATTAAFVFGVLQWLPGGPLGPGWARRAGTPNRLLPPDERQQGGT